MAPVSTLRLCKDWNHLIFNTQLTECFTMILRPIFGINIMVSCEIFRFRLSFPPLKWKISHLSVVKVWIGLTTAQIVRAMLIYRNGCTGRGTSCHVIAVCFYSRIINRLEEWSGVSLSRWVISVGKSIETVTQQVHSQETCFQYDPEAENALD